MSTTKDRKKKKRKSETEQERANKKQKLGILGEKIQLGWEKKNNPAIEIRNQNAKHDLYALPALLNIQQQLLVPLQRDVKIAVAHQRRLVTGCLILVRQLHGLVWWDLEAVCDSLIQSAKGYF